MTDNVTGTRVYNGEREYSVFARTEARKWSRIAPHSSVWMQNYHDKTKDCDMIAVWIIPKGKKPKGSGFKEWRHT